MVHNQKTTVLDSFVDPRAPICYGILKPGEHVSEGIPVIKVKNIIGGRVLEDDLLKTSLQIHNQYKRAEVNQGDLLLTIRGTTGRVAIVPPSLAGANITQDTARIRVSSDDDPMYVFYALQSPSVQQQIDLNTVGQAVKGINIAEVRKLKIFHPDASEQKKIVQILSTWDKAITTTEQLLANSLQQKKALMQQLLTGKKRLLDKNGVRFSGEWKKVRLGTVADMNSGGTPKSNIEEYYGGNIPWVSIADMTKQGKWIASTEKYLTELGLENSSARIYPKDSVLYAMYASIGECSIAQVPLSSSQAILGIRPKSELNFEFLYFFLNSLKEKIKLQGQQGTQSNLNAGMVKDFLLYLPGMEEQKKIAAVLSTADQEISTLQQKLEALKQEKKALMQQLLTGKRRVNIN